IITVDVRAVARRTVRRPARLPRRVAGDGVSATRTAARLSRPDGSDPLGFSRQLADRYNELIAITNAPASVIAREAQVPVTTVHRWIREARQRGALPATRQGRVRASSKLELVADDLGISPELLRSAIARHAPGGLRP